MKTEQVGATQRFPGPTYLDTFFLKGPRDAEAIGKSQVRHTGKQTARNSCARRSLAARLILVLTVVVGSDGQFFLT